MITHHEKYSEKYICSIKSWDINTMYREDCQKILVQNLILVDYNLHSE